ncbi:MAG: alpha-amylase family glycosyl hydrolase [Candidatus Woesearchaeota archaeon]
MKSVFITYPDSFHKDGELPLQTLARLDLSFFDAVHVLPFYPSTSDRGFAVSDFTQVDPAFGSWKDLPRPLMLDCVFNHTSRSHPWLKERPEFYLRYKSPPSTRLFRPRSSPLFTKIGDWFYWTTFSEDQVDLNFSRDDVREELDRLIELYIQQGAVLLRLDAVAYFFKDYDFINTQQTLDYVNYLVRKYPRVRFVAEVNLPQEDIDTYTSFVCAYNFAFAPLMYYALLTGDVTELVNHLNTSHSNYFTVLATHDGIGLQAVTGRIPAQVLIDDTRSKGFFASDYELNINYFDAVGSEEKFLLAHAVLLSLEGISGVYYHSLFGSRGVYATTPRDANRATISFDTLQEELLEDFPRSRVYSALKALVVARRKYLFGSQSASFRDGVLTLLREGVCCVFNFSEEEVVVSGIDLITGKQVSSLPAFGYAWFKK